MTDRERLRKKQIAVVDYISKLREARGWTLSELAERMNVFQPWLSRALSVSGCNLTLKSIARFEAALKAPILVCPGDYEESLIENPARLLEVVQAAYKHNPEFAKALREQITNQTAMTPLTPERLAEIERNVLNYDNAFDEAKSGNSGLSYVELRQKYRGRFERDIRDLLAAYKASQAEVKRLRESTKVNK